MCVCPRLPSRPRPRPAPLCSLVAQASVWGLRETYPLVSAWVTQLCLLRNVALPTLPLGSGASSSQQTLVRGPPTSLSALLTNQNPAAEVRASPGVLAVSSGFTCWHTDTLMLGDTGQEAMSLSDLGGSPEAHSQEPTVLPHSLEVTDMEKMNRRN